MRNFWTNAVSAVASVALTAGIVAFATPAFADTAVPQVKLAYTSGDVATAAGHAKLERRIRLAAAQVCDTDDASSAIDQQRCRTQAVTRADDALAQQIAMAASPATQLASR